MSAPPFTTRAIVLLPPFERRSASISRVAAVLLFFVLVAGCTGLDVINPDPVPVASSPERTESAMRDAMRREGWDVTEREGGYFLSREIEGVPVHAEVEIVGSEIRTKFSRNSIGLSGEEKDAHLRRVRRSLHDLQERIHYLIESADLTAE